METWFAAVRDIGFPAAVALILVWYIRQLVDKLVDKLTNDLGHDIKEMADIRALV